jgi:hypothetical protein
VDPSTGRRETIYAWGVLPPDSGEAGLSVASFPLHSADQVTGILTFVFQGAAIPSRAQALLDRVAEVIEEVWRLALLPGAYAREAARIGELETALADSKIADRACGLLANDAASGSAARESVDTIIRHAESVLRPAQLQNVLSQVTREIEQEIAERELASRAKAVLQSRYGMSEDEAHVHLRLVSRKSRKKLREVAQELIENPAPNDSRALPTTAI